MATEIPARSLSATADSSGLQGEFDFETGPTGAAFQKFHLALVSEQNLARQAEAKPDAIDTAAAPAIRAMKPPENPRLIRQRNAGA